jgi:hypothetical protein
MSCAPFIHLQELHINLYLMPMQDCKLIFEHLSRIIWFGCRLESQEIVLKLELIVKSWKQALKYFFCATDMRLIPGQHFGAILLSACSKLEHIKLKQEPFDFLINTECFQLIINQLQSHLRTFEYQDPIQSLSCHSILAHQFKNIHIIQYSI